ncbi:MAG: TRAP transporter substrate-binding protein DctP [Proteobacteria bacterium]|nr:TRAP transporter substrate-binding protein DctP [Pseudomonadota bacterium]
MKNLSLKSTTLATLLATTLSLVGTAAADPVELKIATLAPAGSPWMEVLGKASEEISKKTEKRVTLKYFEGGQMGDERDFVRKITGHQIDGAAVTAVGLSMIDESIRVLELPMMFASAEEMDFVADKVWPYFQKKFEGKGFRLNDRGEVGWIYFLSKNKVEKIADLKGQKLCSKVKYMTSMPMSFAIGATIVSLDSLKKISVDDQKAVEDIGKSNAKKLRKTIRKANEEAKGTMSRKGVTVVPTPIAMVEDFTKQSQELWQSLVGKIYSKEELAMVLKYRDEYRAKNGGPKPAGTPEGIKKPDTKTPEVKKPDKK